MSISNSIGAAMQFLASPESSYSFRKDLNNESVERVLEDAIRQNQTFEGVVLANAQQTEGVIAEDGTVENYVACKIRILGIHDNILPDPIQTFEKHGPEKTKRLVEMHPIIFSKEKLSAVNPQPGDVVEVSFVDGIPRWIHTSRYYMQYNFGFNIDECGRVTKTIAIGAFETGEAKIAGDINNVIWRTKRASDFKQLTPLHRLFLNKMVENLQALEVPPTGEVVVTSVKRTPKSQATVVYDNIKDNKDWWEYGDTYKNVQDIALDTSLSRQDAIAQMTKAIEEHMASGNFMSKHLRNGALDLRTNNIIGGNVSQRLADFKQAAVDTKQLSYAKIELYEGTS